MEGKVYEGFSSLSQICFFGIPQGIFMLTKSVPSNLNQTKTKQKENRKTILHVRLTYSNTKHWESTQCHFSSQI